MTLRRKRGRQWTEGWRDGLARAADDTDEALAENPALVPVVEQLGRLTLRATP